MGKLYLVPPRAAARASDSVYAHAHDALNATVNNEAKNMASVMFYKTDWHVKAYGNNHYGRAVWSRFLFLLFFLCLNPSYHLLQLFGT